MRDDWSVLVPLQHAASGAILQEEEGYEGHVRGSGVVGSMGAMPGSCGGNGKRRSWDDEYVLKRQFSALIPAFDPRPGRTNVNQTTDLDVPPPGSEDSGSSQETNLLPQPKLRLVLRGPNLPGVSHLSVLIIMLLFYFIISTWTLK